MRIYSVEEMEQDILETEDVAFKIHLEGALFTKLYSDTFYKRIGRRGTVEELRKRIINIIAGEYSTRLPAIDRYPDPNDLYTVYTHETFIRDHYENIQLKYFSGFNDIDLAHRAFSKTDRPVIFLVDHREKLAQMFSKSLH